MEGRKGQRGKWGNKHYELSTQTMTSATVFVLPCSSASQSLSSDPGLSFVFFSLFYMEGPCIHKSYIWEQMGTCVYVCLLSFFIIWKKKTKCSVIAIPQHPCLCCVRGKHLHNSLGRLWLLPAALQEWTFTVHEGWDTVIMMHVNML